MQAAARPIIAAREGRLLAITRAGVSHLPRAGFPSLLHPDDLVVANDAATLPASLAATHVRTSAPIEVRLATRRSLDARGVRRFVAVVFGAGDYRTPTEDQPLPPRLERGDQLQFIAPRASTAGHRPGGAWPTPARRTGLSPGEHTLIAHVVNMCGHPRLAELEFSGTVDSIWQWLATAGRPVQYAYVPDRLEIWDTWTRVAARPVAFEPPSAGFLLDWSMLKAIKERGARFTTITHAAGLSSTGDPDLDRRLPLDEPYEIPPATADLIARTRARGGRVIAIGTTVVRALESAVADDGNVQSGAGLATLRLGPRSHLAVVDAIVSGMHEAGTSHYELLEAFADESILRTMTAEAEARGYMGHEFGDFVFVERRETEATGAEVTGEAGLQTGKRGNGDERGESRLVACVALPPWPASRAAPGTRARETQAAR